MPSFHAHYGGPVAASPEAVYALLADYRTGHPSVVPNPPFVSIEVLEGGVGAGTVLRVHMRAFGKERFLKGLVTEPEPGRVLAETYEEPSASITTFTVDPAEGGSYVTIATRGKTALNGILGSLEAWATEWWLEYLWRKEIIHIGWKLKT